MSCTLEAEGAPITAQELLSVLSGDAVVSRSAYRRCLPFLIAQARQRAPSLPPDLHMEIVQETWRLALARRNELLLRAGEVSGAAYLATLLRNAVEIVKSGVRTAGSRSRGSRDSGDGVVFALVEDADRLQSQDNFDSEDRAREIRLDVERFMESAEPSVRSAVTLMLYSGMTMTDAAAKVGLSRQSLGRRLQRLRTAA